eukprot:760652-Hanusia_phi.AAC.5
MTSDLDARLFNGGGKRGRMVDGRTREGRGRGEENLVAASERGSEARIGPYSRGLRGPGLGTWRLEVEERRRGGEEKGRKENYYYYYYSLSFQASACRPGAGAPEGSIIFKHVFVKPSICE